MVARLCCFSLLVLAFALPSFGQARTCNDGFGTVVQADPDEPVTPQAQVGATTIAWTSPQCILIGSTTGLWLVDISHPDNPYRLAYHDEQAVGSVAVNSEDGSIAFSFAHDRSVHRLFPGGAISTLEAGGSFVTDLAFSSGGTLLGVASMDNEDDLPGPYSPRIQFWNDDQLVTDIVTSEVGVILRLDFSADDQHVLIQRLRSGYFGDQVEYWDIVRAERLWGYDDVLRELSVGRRTIRSQLLS
ncbi:MAG: hypothetical protein IPM16_00190 [Chloroflexi bacterium]|nr:hypothetical protein [Chloroflexota bacterium]